MPDTPGDPGFATKSDLAYTRVRGLILSGELGPGAVLPQAALARTIGISTTPLREALRRLKQEGLSIILVEQNAKLVFDIADDIVILNSGSVALSGRPADLKEADLHQHLGIY